MKTKLTLRLDAALIRRAKVYAGHAGKSVSEIVADFFGRLTDDTRPLAEPLSPAVRSLVGVLGGRRVAEDDYRDYLVEKHR